MRERESMRMKNFIFKSSSDTDFKKIVSVLEIIQAEQRHARYDLQQIQKKLEICVKGIAILVSTPEPDLESEQDGINQDSRDGD